MHFKFNFQTNRQKRSLGKTAKLRGEALLKTLNRIGKELLKMRRAIQGQARKGRKGRSKTNKPKSKKGKSNKVRKGNNQKKEKDLCRSPKDSEKAFELL